jgi:D-3-phosphoglycerate dehydrogenase
VPPLHGDLGETTIPVIVDKKNILITTSSFGEYDRRPLELLEKAGYRYTLNPHGKKVTPQQLLELIGDAIGIIAGTEDLSEPVLKMISKVKTISRCGVGLDNVDLQAAKKFSIKVTRTSVGVVDAVAELTVGLILNLLRKNYLADTDVKSGQWQKPMGNLLSEKKMLALLVLAKPVRKLLSF